MKITRGINPNARALPGVDQSHRSHQMCANLIPCDRWHERTAMKYMIYSIKLNYTNFNCFVQYNYNIYTSSILLKFSPKNNKCTSMSC